MIVSLAHATHGLTEKRKTAYLGKDENEKKKIK